MPDRPPGESGGSPPEVTPYQIWVLLRNNGFTFNEAAGIMGNMISESSLNPEAVQQGVSNPGYGLVQWEASSYPSAPSLVTGNPVADANAQVVFLAQTGGKQAASGSTPAEAGSNFAMNYEKCAECGPGGAQTTSRAAQATLVAGWATKNQWPDNLGGAINAVTDAASAASSASCLYQIPKVDLHVTSVGGWCMISRSQARAVMGALVLTAGAGVTLLGAIILVAAGFDKTSVGRAAGKATGNVMEAGGAVASAAGFPEAGAPVAAAGSAVKGSAGRAGKYAQRKKAEKQAGKKEASARREFEGRQYDEATSRKRDSRKGAAVRDDDEPAPF